MKKKTAPRKANPLRDSWRPSDKAEEARLDNPAEFARPIAAAEDSLGPIPRRHPRTHGD